MSPNPNDLYITLPHPRFARNFEVGMGIGPLSTASNAHLQDVAVITSVNRHAGVITVSNCTEGMFYTHMFLCLLATFKIRTAYEALS